MRSIFTTWMRRFTARDSVLHDATVGPSPTAARGCAPHRARRSRRFPDGRSGPRTCCNCSAHFSGAQSIAGVTEFLDNIKGYLLSIVLAGFTVAGIAVGAAKLAGH